MRGITDQDFLGAIRAGVYKDWDESAFRAELCSPDRIDGVRPLVAAQDLELVESLVASSKELEVLMGHVIGRKLLREHPERLKPRFSAAYGRWRDEGNVLLTVSLFHDLAELPGFLESHIEEFLDLASKSPLAFRSAIGAYVGDDSGLVERVSARLDDVFSGEPRTLNAPAKAFLYVLYLGLIEDPRLCIEAASVISTYLDRGSPAFQELCRSVLESLRARAD